MGVEAHEPQRRGGAKDFDRRRLLVGREAELCVVSHGVHVAVGIDGDVGVRSKQHVDRPSAGRQTRKARELRQPVNDDSAHAPLDGGPQLRVRLARAVQRKLFGGTAGPLCNRQLAEGALSISSLSNSLRLFKDVNSFSTPVDSSGPITRFNFLNTLIASWLVNMPRCKPAVSASACLTGY